MLSGDGCVVVQAAADAKYYGNTEIYYMLKARGAKVPVLCYRSLFVMDQQMVVNMSDWI